MTKILVIGSSSDELNLISKKLESWFESNIITLVDDINFIDKDFDNISFNLVILNFDDFDISGKELLQELREIDPFVDIIIFTECREIEIIKELVNIGIEGYINNDEYDSMDKLLNQVNKLMRL